MIAPHDLLQLADTLARGAGEPEWRASVSRAYYAAFHEARVLLRNLGFSVPRADQAHAYLWLRLGNCADPAIQQAGSQINQLRAHRNQADYDLHRNYLQADAQYATRLARTILRMLAAGYLEPTRTQITDAMKIYERDVLKQVTWTP